MTHGFESASGRWCVRVLAAIGGVALLAGCGAADGSGAEAVGSIEQALEVHQVTCPAGTSSSCALAAFTDDADLDASDTPSFNAMSGWTNQFKTSVASWPGSTAKATFRSAIKRAGNVTIPIELLSKRAAFDVSRGGDGPNNRTGFIVDHWEGNWYHSFAKDDAGTDQLGIITSKQEDRYLSTHYASDVSFAPLDIAYDAVSKQKQSIPILVTVNSNGDTNSPNIPFDVAQLTVRYGTVKLTSVAPCPGNESATCTTTYPNNLPPGTWQLNGQINRPRLRGIYKLFITNVGGSITAAINQAPVAIDSLVIGM